MEYTAFKGHTKIIGRDIIVEYDQIKYGDPGRSSTLTLFGLSHGEALKVIELLGHPGVAQVADEWRAKGALPRPTEQPDMPTKVAAAMLVDLAPPATPAPAPPAAAAQAPVPKWVEEDIPPPIAEDPRVVVPAPSALQQDFVSIDMAPGSKKNPLVKAAQSPPAAVAAPAVLVMPQTTPPAGPSGGATSPSGDVPPELLKATRLGDVLTILYDRGLTTNEALMEECGRLAKGGLKTVAVVTNLPDRISRWVTARSEKRA